MADAGPNPAPEGATGVLVLADGTTVWGRGFGAEGEAVGEVCFNTAMTGYQEIMTDPSYAAQIITFTFPHIGNVGANLEDIEATDAHAVGCVVREDVTDPSNFRATQRFDAWLRANGRIGLAGVDTRALTRLIRIGGAPDGVIAHSAGGEFDIEALLEKARAFPGLEGMDLARDVSCKQLHEWGDGLWRLGFGYEKPSPLQGRGGSREAAEGEGDCFSGDGVQGGGLPLSPALSPEGEREQRPHIVAIDYGSKRNIFRHLVAAGAKVTVLPAVASYEDVMRHAPDGIFLSNGPGDPAATGEYAVPVIRRLIDSGKPVFGICLGHQLLGLAAGAKTTKMHQGHRGANHPVKRLADGRVEITSMNHGFAVDIDTLPDGVTATHVSLFDGSLCGLEIEGGRVFGVQYHPEASPGPQDSAYLFGKFVGMVR
ncbi:MAG: glutamine-hydrolyzing carbamoyl-phosphate synthase small subunit [Sphingomonadales bacterium]|nr:glutamine-hydrolyzing carbamoyl-phosphate synthase small subunit [Sphingomonadales bacterium]